MSSIYFTDSHHNIFLTRRNAELLGTGNIQFTCGTLNFEHKDASIQEALDYRAKEISESHQYIQLFYSGGADSHTILKTFIKNNLPLHEIVLSRWSVSGNFLESQNNEINHIAIPLLQKYQDYISKFRVKISFCDFNLLKIKEVFSAELLPTLHANGIYNPCNYNVINFAWKNLREHKNMCQLLGWEKPSVQYKNKKFYTCMFDKILLFLPYEKDVFNIQENFYFGGDGFLTVNQYRRITELLNVNDYHENEILSNSNKQYFTLVNQNIRDASECESSNTICMGKAFNNTLATKEHLFFTDIKQQPSVWEPIIDYVGSTDFLEINNCCSYSTGNRTTIPPILATQKEII